ncbi:50S ribosomal protein L29 [Candidatus Woesearchaeota archaeon]|nr:50S ribosomal protein L29 [Candidatus Woesearchaeota archaeon]
MKAKELVQSNVSDLQAKLKELQKELVKHNAQVALGANVKNSKALKTIKKDIARVLTILKQKDGDSKEQ